MRFPARFAVRLLPLLSTIGCQDETTTPSPVTMTARPGSAHVEDNTVAGVFVAPDSQLVFWGTLFRVTGQARNAGGEALDRVPAWTVGNTTLVRTQGSSQATMTFKALKVGTTTLTARVDSKSGTSKVVIRGTKGAKVLVTPAETSVEAGGTVQLFAAGRTNKGETAVVNVSWTTNGGTIGSDGILTATSAPGTYRVIGRAAFGAADTSIVTVSGPSNPATTVFLVPETASLAAGETVQFEVYGTTASGDSIPVTVTYAAGGGTIAGGGLYTAGGTAGTFQVIAATAAGLADTSEVTVAAAPIDRVVLLPAIAASRMGETTRFTATVWNALNEQVTEPVGYEATCGTVTGAGVFTAPLEAGSCLVTASAGGQSATVEVVVLRSSLDMGIPFGSYDLWTSNTATQATGGSPFTSSHDYVPPVDMVSHIAAARSKGMSIVLAMTGGSHDRYKTDGVFDGGKWRAAMDRYGTPAIQAAIADGVADGTIIGNSVMDEPQQSGTDSKAWGPAGTMTKLRVDSLCGYVKQLFPTLPAGVGHDHAAFQPNSSYQVCDFFMPQYAARKGGVVAWRDAALAMANRDNLAVLFSMNLLNGGVQDKNGAWDCPGTGGRGDRSPNCRMTPAQVRDFGKTLGQAGCAMLSWKFNRDFVAKVENQEAFSDIAVTLSRLPRTRCSRR
jgi:hypothetical protein